MPVWSADRRLSGVRGWAFSACALLALTACSKTREIPATAVVVVIDAEAMVRADADRLIVQVASGTTPKTLEQRKDEVFEFADGARWPVTLTLVSHGKGEPVFRVWAHAQRGGKDLVDTRAISGFAAGKALLLELLLSDGCIGMLDCEDDQTCVARDGEVACVDASRDVASLGRFKPDDVKHLLERDAGTVADSGPQLAPDATPGMGADAASDAAIDRDAGQQDAEIVDSGSGDSGSADAGTPPSPDPEQLCFNGIDDDGDNKIDCADSDCVPDAICVPLGDLPVVVLSDLTAPCPAPYTQTATDVVRELRFTSACSGCNCSTTPASNCQAPIYFYAQGQCNPAVNSGGLFVGFGSATCTGGSPVSPIGQEEGLYSPFGWRVGAITPVTAATCNAAGSPMRVPPSWNQKGKLCRRADTEVGGGCKQGHMCVPKVKVGTQCAEIAFDKNCGAGVGSDWYTGYDDRRACPSCQCALAGGDCSATLVRLGSDYTCDVNDQFGNHLGPNQIACLTQSVYSPPVDLVGAPTTETCSASSTATGQVLPTGGTRLCCN